MASGKPSLKQLLNTYVEARAELQKELEKTGRQPHSTLEAPKLKGVPLYPHELARDAVLTFYVVAILLLLAAFAPPPLHEAADPQAPTPFPPPLPDWYLLWAFGALKIAWDIKIVIPGVLGGDDTEIFLMTAKVWGTIMQGVLFGLAAMVPFIDKFAGAFLEKKRRIHVMARGKARRPIEDPLRAAMGVAMVALVFMLSLVSVNINISLYYPQVTFKLLKLLTVVVPVVSFILTYLFLDYRRSEGQRPLTDGEREHLYRHGIISRPMQRIYEFKLNRCYQCGLCDEVCPVRDAEGEEDLNIIYNTFQNQHEGVALWSCITCGHCTAVCPQNIEYAEYVLVQRRLAAETGEAAA